MLRLNPLFPSLSFLRTTHIPLLLVCQNCVHQPDPYLYRRPMRLDVYHAACMPIQRQTLFCTGIKANIQSLSSKAMKKKRRELPENVLKHKLDMCSRAGNLTEALRLYEEARHSGIKLVLHHYNVLFYLCSCRSSSLECENVDDANNLSHSAVEKGFEIFQEMVDDKILPNEATFTSLARLAVAAEDPEMAFDLVKQMKNHGIPPKLRSYGPALFGFCEKGDTDKGFEVDVHMTESRVALEEPELSALLKVSIVNNRIDKVYEMLHRLRATVRQVSVSTLQIIEDWFKSNQASKVGCETWDVNKIKEGVAKGGGGWHGQGWLGSGSWRVVRNQVDDNGVCLSCGEKLLCIDIDPEETKNFASKLNSLACERETKADFLRFQEWLKQNGPFDAVIDGANVGLVNNKQFNFSQLKNVVYRLRQLSTSKRMPLIILHRSRVTTGPSQIKNNRILLDGWNKSGALYATPAGSNDDWYWLYAAVSCNCLLVTNDEMRDHLFELLGDSFFPRWKEKHQVRLSVSRTGLNLLMPPPYSSVIQESECGSWHVPKIMEDNDVEGPRQWLCASRVSGLLQKQCLQTGE